MGRKRKKPICDHPVAKELAWILKHPDSGHPMAHDAHNYQKELIGLEKELKRLYPNNEKKQMSSQIIRRYINGERKPVLKTVKLFIEAFNSIYLSHYDPEKWFQTNTLNLAGFTDKQKDIARNICVIDNETILKAILGMIQPFLNKKHPPAKCINLDFEKIHSKENHCS